MIYRAGPTLKRSAAGRAVIEEWRREFQQLFATQGPAGDVARQIPDGLVLIQEGLCPYGADPLASPPQAGVERFVETFRLHRWPVTNAMYELFDPGHLAHRWCGGGNPHPLAGPGERGDDTCPVVNVTWHNAWCFAAWCGCRLPTELEWEHAARKGSSTAWFCGDDERELKKYAHFDQDWRGGSTLPVDDGARLPNANGLYDMAGQVWEWCQDLWVPAASARVLRGGGWDRVGGYCRSVYRLWRRPDFRDRRYGFRLAAVPVVGAEAGQQARGA
jgi:formylglycine-generating enzyme required for sulfatase activity